MASERRLPTLLQLLDAEAAGEGDLQQVRALHPGCQELQ